jgi:hypothetical protein
MPLQGAHAHAARNVQRMPSRAFSRRFGDFFTASRILFAVSHQHSCTRPAALARSSRSLRSLRPRPWLAPSPGRPCFRARPRPVALAPEPPSPRLGLTPGLAPTPRAPALARSHLFRASPSSNARPPRLGLTPGLAPTPRAPVLARSHLLRASPSPNARPRPGSAPPLATFPCERFGEDGQKGRQSAPMVN